MADRHGEAGCESNDEDEDEDAYGAGFDENVQHCTHNAAEYLADTEVVDDLAGGGVGEVRGGRSGGVLMWLQ